MKHVFLIAGEPSGDRLGAALMAGLKALHPGIRFSGIGGTEMEAEGLASLFPMEVLSVMGLAEILPRLPDLLRRRDEAAHAVIAAGPDALITIDSPDFCLRVAAKVRHSAPRLPIAHYVAPSVWAWRPARAQRMARSVDHVLALLPFEPPYMEAAGMTCDFVGHPVAAEPRPTEAEVTAFRARHGLDGGRIALVLPGSRRSEVSRLAPIFGAALEFMPENVQVVIPTLPHLRETLEEESARWPIRPVVLTERDDKRAAFAAADAALAASGTVSLELAAADTPMVVAYDMNWLSWQILSRMVKLDTVTLVNLVTGRRAVPEFLGPACKPGPIGAALARLLTVPSEADRQRAALSEAMEALGRGGEPPGLRAARSVTKFWRSPAAK